MPWVMEFTEENAQRIFGGDATQHMIMFGDKTNDAMKAVSECYQGVCLLTRQRPLCFLHKRFE